MKTNTTLFCLIISIGFLSMANADKYNSVQTGFLRSNNPNNNLASQNQGEENSSVTIDFSVRSGESWDGIHDSSNLIANCVNGIAITGVEWNNVSIQTQSDSWLSEANILISDSNNEQGVELAIGKEDRNAGSATYSSNGILDFTDAGVNDIFALSDGAFPIQFFEEFDNVSDSIEAYFTAGTVTLWGENLSANPDCTFMLVATSDLEVTLDSDATNSLDMNDAVVFTSTIHNIGTVSASNIIISDTLTGLNFVDASCDNGSVGTYNNASRVMTINIDSISAGDSLVCNINTRVSSFGDLNYNTSVLADNDSVSGNNTASISLMGPAIVIPVNNWLFLAVLFFSILLLSRRFIKI